MAFFCQQSFSKVTVCQNGAAPHVDKDQKLLSLAALTLGYQNDCQSSCLCWVFRFFLVLNVLTQLTFFFFFPSVKKLTWSLVESKYPYFLFPKLIRKYCGAFSSELTSVGGVSLTFEALEVKLKERKEVLEDVELYVSWPADMLDMTREKDDYFGGCYTVCAASGSAAFLSESWQLQASSCSGLWVPPESGGTVS